jgi:hypothetical protein
MKKVLIAVLVTLIPLAVFAQVQPQANKPMMDRQAELLKSFKLSDAQIAQVQDIEKSMRATAKSDRAHIQLLNAQIKVALLPSNANPDVQAIDKLIDQKTQLRADIEKALVSARLQLTQIMGSENCDELVRMYMMHRSRFGFFPKETKERQPEGGRGPMGFAPSMGDDTQQEGGPVGLSPESDDLAFE